jgi:hypothetical protein
MPHRDGFQNSLSFTISLCLVFTIAVAAARFWIRRGSYGIDDAIIAFGTVTSLVRTGLNYSALQLGMGQPAQSFSTGEALTNLNDVSLRWDRSSMSTLLTPAALVRKHDHVSGQPVHHQVRDDRFSQPRDL